MSKKCFALMAVLGFIFVMLFDWAIHHNVLALIYEQTPDLWRDQAGMEEYCRVYMGVTFLIVAVLAFIFTRNYEGGGIGEGVRFGSYLGSFAGLNALIMVCFMPISWTLAGAWFGSALIQIVCLGIIFSMVCDKCCGTKSKKKK